MNIINPVQLRTENTLKSNIQAHVRVAGVGSYLPPTRKASTEIDQQFGRKLGKTEARTGIHSRPVVTSESSSFMAIAAAQSALKNAGMPSASVDLIISACAVPEQPIPAMAPLIQAGLGLKNSGIPAFDINASCLSFVAAFDLVAQMVETGRFRHVLIVSSEIASRALPWSTDPDTAAMFGDGAAAAVLTASHGQACGLMASHFETWSEGYRDCELPSGGTRFDFHGDHAAFANGAVFKMDGRAAYKLAAKTIQPFLETLLAKANWSLNEVDVVVPHQASRGALDHLVAKLKIPREKIIDIIADHGNQIAASIPMALDHGFRSGRIKAGMKVLVVGTSAGFSLGGLCLQMP